MGPLCFAKDAPRLRVATFCCDVTPPLGSPIRHRPLATVEHPLLAKGIVLDDGHQRCIVCAVDWCLMTNTVHLMFRAKMATAAGTDPSRVAVQCVHQHTRYTSPVAREILPWVSTTIDRVAGEQAGPASPIVEGGFARVRLGIRDCIRGERLVRYV